MKKATVLLLILSGWMFPALCQKIEVKEVDKFTNKQRIETDYVNVRINFTNTLQMKIRTVDTSAFIIFFGTWAVGVVGTNDAFTFLFEDKSTLNIYPTSIQSYNIAVGTYGSDNYTQQYRISKEDITTLSSKLVVSVRRSLGDTYSDQDVKEKNAKKIRELAHLVSTELAKN